MNKLLLWNFSISGYYFLNSSYEFKFGFLFFISLISSIVKFSYFYYFIIFMCVFCSKKNLSFISRYDTNPNNLLLSESSEKILFYI